MSEARARAAGRRAHAGVEEQGSRSSAPDRVGLVSADTVDRLDEETAAGLLPERDPKGHKGTFGRLLVVAGSLDYAGAALMSGAAALRAGAGLVTLCLPASLQPYLAGRVPELITLGLPEKAPGEVLAAAAAALVSEREHDALLVGPGLRPGAATTRLVVLLAAQAGPAVVLDAERPGSAVRSPRLADAAGPGRSAHAAPGRVPAPRTRPGQRRRRAARGRAVGGTRLGPGGRPQGRRHGRRRSRRTRAGGSLHPAGPGQRGHRRRAGRHDRLAPRAGVWPLEAAALGVFLHGRAGEHVSERLGDAGLLATDLLPEIPASAATWRPSARAEGAPGSDSRRPRSGGRPPDAGSRGPPGWRSTCPPSDTTLGCSERPPVPGSGWRPSSRPTPTATGSSRWRARSTGPSTRSAWRRSTRASSFGRPAWLPAS